MNSYKWIDAEVPKELEIRQVYGFIFSPDGRIVLLEDEGIFNLPGGKPEDDESMSETLIREAAEEVQITISSLNYLGYQLVTIDEKFAQVRLVALIDQVGRVRSSTARKCCRGSFQPWSDLGWITAQVYRN